MVVLAKHFLLRYGSWILEGIDAQPSVEVSEVVKAQNASRRPSVLPGIEDFTDFYSCVSYHPHVLTGLCCSQCLTQ